MSNALLSSKVIVTEEPPRISSVTSLPTAILGMIGLAQRGPVGTAVLSTSFEEWTTVFGGYDLNTKDTIATVEGFFEEGGQFLWFVRTARYTDIDDVGSLEALASAGSILTPAATAAGAAILGNLLQTFALADADTLVVSVSGGGDITSTFNTGPAFDTGSNTSPFVLVDGFTLVIAIDGEAGQLVTFNTADFSNIAVATIDEVIAVVLEDTTDVLATDEGGALRITNARGNGTGFDIEETGGTGSAIMGFTPGAVTGTGDAADAAAVTVAELTTMFDADIAGTATTNVGGAVNIATVATGLATTLEIKALSTLDTKLGLSNLLATGNDTAAATATLALAAKYPGTYGDNVVVRIAAANNGDADKFDLIVLENGVQKEQFNNLTMDDLAVQGFVEDVINAAPASGGSELIAVTDSDAGLGSPTLDRPVNGDATLTGGDDGLTNIADVHFVGSSIALNGIRALDVAGDVTLLTCPARITAVVHNALLTYAEVTRNGTMFCVLDPPASQTAQQMVTYVESTALLLEASEFGAIYFPQVRVINPNTTVFGIDDFITVPPSGHICGRMARTDTSSPGGVYRPPAGLRNGRLATIIGLEILANKEVPETDDVNKRDLIYPKRINPISELTGGRIIDGVRTLKSTGNFPTVAERRGVIFIETTVKNTIEPARFRNNDGALRREVSRSVEAFLLNQMRVDAFRSKDPKKAFSVDFGDGLNPDSVIFSGQLIGRIGLATQKPAEFIILKFTQDTRALEQELSQP